MPTIGHVVVGLAAGKLQSGEGSRWRSVLVLASLATFQDLDVLWPLASEYTPWSHRGALHSLAAATVAAAIGALLLDRRRSGYPVAFLLALATAASHGLLDAATHGGDGVMLLWPFSEERFLAAWHPLGMSPFGSYPFFTRGLLLLARELLLLSPLLLYALWPRGEAGDPRPPRRGERAPRS